MLLVNWHHNYHDNPHDDPSLVNNCLVPSTLLFILACLLLFNVLQRALKVLTLCLALDIFQVALNQLNQANNKLGRDLFIATLEIGQRLRLRISTKSSTLTPRSMHPSATRRARCRHSNTRFPSRKNSLVSSCSPSAGISTPHHK